MARKARQFTETNCYHIMLRGNNKSYIFGQEADKQFYLGAIEKVAEDGEIALIAWCIMDNHVHLVAKLLPESMSTVLKRINITYANYWHRKNQSCGHVFQDRYKSEPIETDESLINVVRYVHNNPVKANMVDAPHAYKWSSYNAYINHDLSESMQMVWQLLGGSEQSFRNFHSIQDYTEYLDTAEDNMRIQEESAQAAISSVCEKYGIAESNQIYSRPEILNEMIMTIKNRSNISGRKMAKLIGVSESRIRRVK